MQRDELPAAPPKWIGESNAAAVKRPKLASTLFVGHPEGRRRMTRSHRCASRRKLSEGSNPGHLSVSSPQPLWYRVPAAAETAATRHPERRRRAQHQPHLDRENRNGRQHDAAFPKNGPRAAHSARGPEGADGKVVRPAPPRRELPDLASNAPLRKKDIVGLRAVAACVAPCRTAACSEAPPKRNPSVIRYTIPVTGMSGSPPMSAPKSLERAPFPAPRRKLVMALPVRPVGSLR